MQTHQRRSIRLPNFDYSSQGAYYITLVTWNRDNLFGEIVEGEMRLSDWGIILGEEWEKTATIRPEIELDAYQIMPNHFHAIIVIRNVRADGCPPVPSGAHDAGAHGVAADGVGAHGGAPRPILERKPRSLGSCIAGIKSITTKRINLLRQTPGTPVWQRNYYEHIIRNQEEWQRIRAYIQANPNNWQLDNENPLKRQ